ncbi:hypothetical protein WJX81_007243 [Elliptochloris bilobata]|uniref:Origin recognition complex subunit 4 n=1 Tax=Elliptochloris bilobata TaxID=381761 RepID=A0AAW1RAC0_9CHLO
MPIDWLKRRTALTGEATARNRPDDSESGEEIGSICVSGSSADEVTAFTDSTNAQSKRALAKASPAKRVSKAALPPVRGAPAAGAEAGAEAGGAANACVLASFAALSAEERAAGVRAAARFISRRLTDPAGGGPEEGGGMRLRGELGAHATALGRRLADVAARPGVNTSVLLVGPRGVGKTLVVERVLTQLAAEVNRDPGCPVLGVVRVNGGVHAEERAAFREIARQLCMTFSLQYQRSASLEDNMGFLADMFLDLRRGHKAVVFVLDEFDGFARRPKQTLLYNLLDALHRSDMQSAVLCLSVRHDVMHMMEKRVLSRFSFRKALVLSLAAELRTPARPAPAPAGRAWGPPGGAFAVGWNAALRRALAEPALLAALQALHDQGLAEPRDLAQVAQLAVLGLAGDPGFLRAADLAAAVTEVAGSQQTLVDAVRGLSVLELYMLVAVVRLQRRGGAGGASFERAFAEYSSLQRLHRTADAYGRAAALRAFERLLGAALLEHPGGRTERGALREFAPVEARAAHQEIEAGLARHASCPPLLKAWLAHEVVHQSAPNDDD